ncbi:MAG: DUF4294 domain-containing protein [Odoribacter sp.]
MSRIIITILFLFCAIDLSAQHREIVHALIQKGDTIPHVWLEEVIVRAKSHRANWYRRYNNRNTRLEYNVRKVYPYARTAAGKINEIEQKLSRVHKESERKKVIKEEYSQLMATFKAPLMKLSITQGKILIRLIYRETNHTSFAHIREYKGYINAYFWQSVALIFGNNLKAAYDPQGEDADIEQIIQQILQEEKGL